MKISLNLDHIAPDGGKELEAKQLEKLILATKEGNFEARDALIAHYMPLLTSLAKKRGEDGAAVNRLIEAGRRGLLTAAQKYRPAIGPEKFKLFALDFIEKEMSSAGHSGFFSRLFGKG